jgi:hypothetical protein
VPDSKKTIRSVTARARRAALRRAAIILVVTGASGLCAYHFLFRPWRAADLARKSVASLDAGNFRLAFVQLSSARDIRADNPAVLRAAAIFEGKLGRRESLDLWEEVALRAALSNDDRSQRAVAAMLYGTDEQFAKAAAELDGAGDKIKAWALRIGRFSFRGNLDSAVGEARRAIAETGDPGLKLGYAKLLLRRYGAPDWIARKSEGIAAFEQMAAIVDELQDTPEAQPALAFGLDFLKAPPEFTQRWTDAAFADPRADNPALLPAAEAAVQSGKMTVQEVHTLLSPAYKNAPTERRAAFALWLSGHGLTSEAVAFIDVVEASKDPVAFTALADAHARRGEWKAVIEAADSSTGPPESVRVLTRARAEIGLGGSGDKAVNSIRLGLQAAAREGRLPAALGMADKLSGGPKVANEELLLLCENPGTADLAFRLLQARLIAGEGTAALLGAHDKAKAAAPHAPTVKDFGRYLELFRGGLAVEPADTAAALQADPSYIPMRITRALMLLRRNKPAEADAVFDDITIYFDQMPPAYQAVLAAISEANGRSLEAAAMASRIDKSNLTTGEKDLLRKIQPSPGL